jgi:hypothetical protein
MTQTQKTATNWAKNLIAERGIKQAYTLMRYNVEKNPYFKESNEFITAVWQEISRQEKQASTH